MLHKTQYPIHFLVQNGHKKMCFHFYFFLHFATRFFFLCYFSVRLSVWNEKQKINLCCYELATVSAPVICVKEERYIKTKHKW